VYEWRVLRVRRGVLARRFFISVLGWIAAFAASASLSGKSSKIPLFVFGAGMITLAVTIWLGLLVRLLRPGIFVAEDKVKIRNTLWTYVLLKADITRFEHEAVSAPSFAARGVEAIWVVRRDGRRVETQVQTRAARRNPYRRADPGPKLTPREIDDAVIRLNRWIG
jgi:hypothetical protein